MTTEDLAPLIRAARRNLRFDEPLAADDPRLVDLNAVRGDFRLHRFLFELGIDAADGPLDAPPDCQYVLFGGHRGCGKSTELRRLAAELHRPDRYYVVLVDVLKLLDVNDVEYSDVLLAQAEALTAQLGRDGIDIDGVHVERLQDWFFERIESHTQTKELAAELKAGAEVKAGLPFLGRLLAGVVNSIRANSVHKHELRRMVRASFPQFADACNGLIEHARERVRAEQQGQGLLFIVDGTDRLRGDDADAFFERDVYQLKMVRANAIYCAPIDLISERGVLAQSFSIVRLPMIKLADKHAETPLPEAMDTMRRMALARIDGRLFTDARAILDYLIRISGGHPRDLIRLLSYALAESFGRPIDHAAAEEAVRRLATDYRRIIQQEDYALLAAIDRAPPEFTPIDGRTRRLLYDLALLEYNSFWWASHPAVRTLEGYCAARHELASADTPDVAE
jgi:energy-coupling factor transporter ATP-binding protein EcfA2